MATIVQSNLIDLFSCVSLAFICHTYEKKRYLFKILSLNQLLGNMKLVWPVIMHMSVLPHLHM